MVWQERLINCLWIKFWGLITIKMFFDKDRINPRWYSSYKLYCIIGVFTTQPNEILWFSATNRKLYQGFWQAWGNLQLTDNWNVESRVNILIKLISTSKRIYRAVVTDPDLQLRGRGAVLFCLPCRLFFLLWLFLSFPKRRGGGPLGSSPRSATEQNLHPRILRNRVGKVSNYFPLPMVRPIASTQYILKTLFFGQLYFVLNIAK